MASEEPRLWRKQCKEMSAPDVFAMFARKNSNSLDVKELRQVFFALGNKKTVTDMQEILIAADTDNNGTIDYEEYKKLLETYLKDPDVEAVELMQAFNLIDKEKTGTLTKKQLSNLMMSLPDLFTEEDVDQLEKIYADMDTDGDGRVHIDELVNYVCKEK